MKIYLTFLVLILACNTVSAQCFGSTYSETWAAPTIQGAPGQISGTGFNFGDYLLITGLQAGCTYLFSTCGSPAADTRLTITDSSGSNVMAYNDNNGPLCSGPDASIQYFVSLAGNYQVHFCGIGSTTEVSFSITLVDCNIVEIVENEKKPLLQLFPNPTDGKLGIITNPGTALRIIDVRGAVIKEIELRATEQVIDIEQLPSSLYFYQLMEGAEVLETGKFIKN